MKQLFINGHLTSVRDCDKGDCVSYVADGAVGWISRMVASMVEAKWVETTGGGGGYNHQILK